MSLLASSSDFFFLILGTLFIWWDVVSTFPINNIGITPLFSHLYVHIAQKDKTQISSLRTLSYQGTAPTFGVKLVAFQANPSWPLRSNMSKTGMSQICGNLNLVLKLKWNARIQKKYVRIHEQFRCKTKHKQHTTRPTCHILVCHQGTCTAGLSLPGW